jgi:hypothetical protein
MRGGTQRIQEEVVSSEEGVELLTRTSVDTFPPLLLTLGPHLLLACVILFVDMVDDKVIDLCIDLGITLLAPFLKVTDVIMA